MKCKSHMDEEESLRIGKRSGEDVKLLLTCFITHGMVVLLNLSIKFQLRQLTHNLNRLHAYIDYTQQQIQYISRITDLFRPVVGVVGYSTFGVRSDLIPFHHPLNRGLPVYHTHFPA